MPASGPARFSRLAALVILSAPVAAGLLLLTPGRALAEASGSTITCPKSTGAAGGVTVGGTNHTCEAVTGTAPTVVIGATVNEVGCGLACGRVTLTVDDPDSNQFTDGNTAAGTYSLSITVTAPVPGTYVATLSGDGADVRTSFDVVLPPSATASSAASTTPPAKGATGGSAPSAGSSGTPAKAGAAPSTGSGHGAAVGGTGQLSVVKFPALAPPAGIAALPSLPAFPAPSTHRADGVPGPYGKTLPYDGSVTVAERNAAQPTLLRHVADTVDDKQFAASIAAALLALLFAAHLRRFVRRPAGDADL